MGTKQQMTAAQKAALTRALKKLHPEYAHSNVKWSDFSSKEIAEAKKYVANQKKKREKRKLAWTKLQIVKYLNKVGIAHDFTSGNVPKTVVEKMSKNENFLKFKKFEGYRLLFQRLKKRSPKSNKEVRDFIKLLDKERKLKKESM